MELVCIEDYGLEGNNWYFNNAEKFGITLSELLSVGVLNDKAYLNKNVCIALQNLNQELVNNYNLKLLIKDAYRSIELYKLIIQKRIKLEGEKFVNNVFNTRNDFPHATGNTIDITFVNIHSGEQIKLFKNIEDLEQRRLSRVTNYYQNSSIEEEININNNRNFMKNILNKYGFIGIDHEYWHFTYQE